MAFIYKITNDVNGKVYIGKTLFGVERRWREHIKDSSRERYKGRPLYRAMNKYGIEHFSIETIEQCTDENASEREKYWIGYYRSFRYGYNATCGGDGKTYVNRALVILLWLANKSRKFIIEFTGYSDVTVKAILNNIGITHKDILNRSDKGCKPVNMLDLNGNFLRRFDSLLDAVKSFNGAKSSHTHISQVCRGLRKTAFGYKWEFA